MPDLTKREAPGSVGWQPDIDRSPQRIHRQPAGELGDNRAAKQAPRRPRPVELVGYFHDQLARIVAEAPVRRQEPNAADVAGAIERDLDALVRGLAGSGCPSRPGVAIEGAADQR